MNKKLGFFIAILIAICAFAVWRGVRPSTVYLSDMKFYVEDYDWTEPAVDETIDGNPIRIADHLYAKGVSTHATTIMEVAVPRWANRFVAEVGIDSQVKPDAPSSVRFIVYGDGAVLYESPVMHPMDPPRRVDVWVDEIDNVKLVADAGADNNSDHADWADAKFVR